MLKILAIDDIKDNLISLKAIITDIFPGSSVISALNGTEGIQLAFSENPDVILLDIVMPGMDGFEVCVSLKREEQLRDIPVVFLTATKENRENRIKALECGAEGFLSKPIDETELTAQIRAMVKIHQANKKKMYEKERLTSLVKERTQELEQSEQRWITTLASIGDAVIATDIAGNITFMNAEAENLTGWKLKECVNKPSGDFFKIVDEETNHPAGNPALMILNERKPQHAQSKFLVRKNERRIPIEDSAAPIKTPDGKITGVVLVFRDISERKLTEELIKNHGLYLEELVKKRTNELELAKSEAESANKIKSAFMSNLSHELRAPLNSIIGFSGLLLREIPGTLNDEQKKQLDLIQSGGSHLLGLINDILDLSKIESGQLKIYYEDFQFDEVLDEVLKMQEPLAGEKGISLNLCSRTTTIKIQSDRQRIKQVLLNLINNAIKFTAEGSVNIMSYKENNSVNVSISDTGIGIKEENISKLFRPFIQIENDHLRPSEGSGLGLSICKKLIDLLQGEISVQSDFGIGSTFTITLPMMARNGSFNKE